MSTQHWNALLCLTALFVAEMASSARGMETQIAIDQNKAIAGGVTPGDTAGFPITLTQPGRYVLTSNLYPPSNVHGIEIEAFDVTIDLNGFLLQGGGLARFGIIGKEVHTVSIQNGTIALFDGAGILGGNSGRLKTCEFR